MCGLSDERKVSFYRYSIYFYYTVLIWKRTEDIVRDVFYDIINIVIITNRNVKKGGKIRNITKEICTK